MSKPDYVYVLREEGGDPSLVKIGHSIDPINRPKGYKAGNYRRLTVVYTILGGQELEAEIHGRFPMCRIGDGGDEWFKLTPELVDFLTWEAKNVLTSDTVLAYSSKNFGGPISIPSVELGVVETRIAPLVSRVDSVQPYSVSEAEPPKSPYRKVGRK